MRSWRRLPQRGRVGSKKTKTGMSEEKLEKYASKDKKKS
jgi:hypothetical protein